jgi:lactoylglutathione lyase
MIGREGRRRTIMTARELRFAFVVDDYEVTLRLFRDVLGLEVIEDFEEQEGRGVLMAVPTATVEILDRAHGDWVDRIETGRSLGERVRIAVRVDALRAAADAVREAGAEIVAEPIITPWGDHNQRFAIPGAMQLTLFSTP